MASTVVNSDATDGDVRCFAVADYTAAREGTGSFGTNSIGKVGQDFDTTQYDCYQSFFNFDLLAAGIPATVTVTAALLEMYLLSTTIDTDFNVEARTKDWGSSIDPSDFVAGSSLSGQTLLCTVSTAGLTTSAYNTITQSGTALKDATALALAGDGVVRIMLDSSRQASGDAPTPVTAENELVLFRTSSDASGNRPKLTVTYTAAATFPGTRNQTHRTPRIGRR